MTISHVHLHTVYFLPPIILAILWRLTFLLKKKHMDSLASVRVFIALGHLALLNVIASIEFVARKDQTAVLFVIALVGKVYMMITVAIVPIIIVYLFLSKYIIAGVTLGGVKE